MPRPIWKGTITFGLVEIPVRLHSAVAHQEEISFTMLDRRDHAPIRYERLNSKTNEPVAWHDIVKAYENSPGEYVVLTPEDLQRANATATQMLDILQFVDAAEIAPVYWDTPYFVEPANRKSRAYALLREILRRTKKIGIATVVLRTRQRLAAPSARATG